LKDDLTGFELMQDMRDKEKPSDHIPVMVRLEG